MNSESQNWYIPFQPRKMSNIDRKRYKNFLHIYKIKEMNSFFNIIKKDSLHRLSFLFYLITGTTICYMSFLNFSSISFIFSLLFNSDCLFSINNCLKDFLTFSHFHCPPWGWFI